MAGINVVLVPFRTSPDVVVALLRDDIQMDIDFYAALKSSLYSAKGRADRGERAAALAGACECPDRDSSLVSPSLTSRHGMASTPRRGRLTPSSRS